MKKYPDFKLGDRVAYKAEYLRNLGVFEGTYEMAQARGTITELQHRSQGPALATIKWDNEEAPA